MQFELQLKDMGYPYNTCSFGTCILNAYKFSTWKGFISLSPKMKWYHNQIAELQ